MSRYLLRLYSLLLLFPAALTPCFAQTATPAVTSNQAAPAAPADPEKVMSREDRIKQHHERIEKIIQENRKKQAEEQQRAQAAAQAATGQTTAAASAPAGGPLPTGPIQPATMTPPIQQASKPQSQSPLAARSESRTILMFQPMDNVVYVGETFETDVVAETKTGTIDTVSFLLRYSKQILNPLALDHSAIDPYVEGEMEYAFDPHRGEIYFRAHLKQPTRFAQKGMVKIVWEALEPTNGTLISFAFDPERPTGLFSKEVNLLGTVPNANDGIIKASVMVKATNEKRQIFKVPDNGLMITTQRFAPGAPILELRLEPAATTVKEGEEFAVDVMLDNPQAVSFDRIRLVASFDPAVLEVVDVDSGNKIRSGVNIEDGFAASEFPFDFARANQVDNRTGSIRYEMASEFFPVRGSGAVAAIHFRAKRATDAVSITLVKGPSGTIVDFLKVNMLIPQFNKGNVVADTSIRVMPDPAGAARAAALAKKDAPNPFRSRLGTTFDTD